MSSVSFQILQRCNAYLSAGLPSQGAGTCSICELVLVSSAGGAVTVC